MKKVLFKILILVLIIPAVQISAQKVYISKDVAHTAGQIKFEYKDVVKKAQNKNGEAVAQLFEFSRILDGNEISEHAVTCLEVIALAGDEVSARAIQKLNSKLKKVSKDRLVSAQSRTEKEELKKPIKKWAPYTWEALNDRPVIIRKQPATQPGSLTAKQKAGQDSETPAAKTDAQTDAKAGPALVNPNSQQQNPGQLQNNNRGN